MMLLKGLIAVGVRCPGLGAGAQAALRGISTSVGSLPGLDDVGVVVQLQQGVCCGVVVVVPPSLVLSALCCMCTQHHKQQLLIDKRDNGISLVVSLNGGA
jgi:hypothetical protein